MSNILDPYNSLGDGYRSTVVSVVIGGNEYVDLQEYSWDTDILQLGDPVSVTIGNAEGQHSTDIRLADSLKLYVADPNVNGGAKTLRLTGLVTGIEFTSDETRGSVMIIKGADLGWHLANNCGPIWLGLDGITWQHLLDGVINPSWGFQTPARLDNLQNVHLNQGRAGRARQAQQDANLKAILPYIQFEPGEVISDVLIKYARLAKRLVNVSADGYLQIFAPTYTGDAPYEIHLHNPDDHEAAKNNAETARASLDLDGIYTDVLCEGSVVLAAKDQDSSDPNAGKFHGRYTNKSPAPYVAPGFFRRSTFADGERLTRTQAAQRAQWKFQRGLYDAQTLEYTMQGLSYNPPLSSGEGVFYTADTLAAVHDSVHGIQGNFYIGAARFHRKFGGGTTTTLTLHPPGLLSA